MASNDNDSASSSSPDEEPVLNYEDLLSPRHLKPHPKQRTPMEAVRHVRFHAKRKLQLLEHQKICREKCQEIPRYDNEATKLQRYYGNTSPLLQTLQLHRTFKKSVQRLPFDDEELKYDMNPVDFGMKKWKNTARYPYFDFEWDWM